MIRPEDKHDFLGGMTLAEVSKALHEDRLVLDFGGPALTLGDKLSRSLYVDQLNRELEKMGSPCRIESREKND